MDKYIYSGSKEDILNIFWSSDQEELLYLGDSFPQPSTQMVSHSSEQDTKHWDSHQGIEDAEQLPSFCFGRNVSKTCTCGIRGRRAVV